MSEAARDSGLSFVAPGPGHWTLDLSHFDGGTTPIAMESFTAGVETAMAAGFAEQGVPARTLAMRWVNGFVYSRLMPLVGANRSSAKAPPDLAVKLLTRVHPKFRRRTKAAAQTLSSPTWRQAVDDYYAGGEQALIEANETLQRVDVGSLGAEQLAEHVADLLAHLVKSCHTHFELHNADLGCIALLAHRCKEWGIPASEIVGALSGASPHTSEPARLLEDVREELASKSTSTSEDPGTLDELRGVSPEIAELVDAYMARQGWVIYSRYDIDGLTLAETPEMFLSTVRSGSVRDRTVDHDAVIGALRAKVPSDDRPDFDTYVSDARYAMGMRDAQGPLTVHWPNGLLRRAMLEVGRRGVARGDLERTEHVFGYERDELLAVSARPEAAAPTGADSFVAAVRSASEMAEAHELRMRQKRLTPPRSLGPAEAAPSLDALPRPLADLTAMISGVLEDLGMGPSSHDPGPNEADSNISGVGIGTDVFTGVARVATSPEDALNSLEPGEVLVTLTTTPAYNLVLTMVGGLVTAEGGPVSHAAVLSRELGIPAVIGARDAMQRIKTGDTVEIDPLSGTVRVVD